MYFFQLDMRRKQFHVLIAAIHELQQILKGKYTHSLTVGLFQDDNTFDIHYSSFVFWSLILMSIHITVLEILAINQ
jgi:hypothetical protein